MTTKENETTVGEFYVEIVREVWANGATDRYEVGRDRDGLDMIEVRYRADDGKIVTRQDFTIEQARLVAAAMFDCADEIEAAR